MDSNISVSKGVFVFKNNLTALKERKKRNLNVQKLNFNICSDQLWYHAYMSMWKFIQRKIDTLNKEMFSYILANLLHFIRNSYWSDVCEIPTAALLTGINTLDHVAQFTTLIEKIKQDVSSHVACLYSQDCQNTKSFIENMIDQFINNNVPLLRDESVFETESKYKIKKGQFSFSTLQAWYEKEHHIAKQHKSANLRKKYERKVLVVIIPDFESFNGKVLQEVILITSSYINVLPFVFVFGIATSLSILHKTLPYHVSSKVNIQYFNSQPSTVYLNNILENIFFTNECPFHLGGRVFNLLMDIFLFYDLSVTNFIKNYKYAMLEHFSYGDVMTLCTKKRSSDIISEFDHRDCENVRHLPSFRKLVEDESYKRRIKLLTDDDYFKLVLNDEINKIQQYLSTFHLFLKCLKVLIADLPNNPLGKQLRDLYSKAVSSDITKTNEYKTCFQLLQFLSKDELNNKILQIIEFIKSEHIPSNTTREMLKKDLEDIHLYLEEMQNSNICINETDMLAEKIENVNISSSMDRKHFKEVGSITI